MYIIGIKGSYKVKVIYYSIYNNDVQLHYLDENNDGISD